MGRFLSIVLLVSAATATPVVGDVKGPGGKVIDCFCTDRTGGRVELGQTICLQVDGRMFMAQCQMSLNVPMWREVQKGCLSSDLQGVNPLPHSRPVHAGI